MILFFGLPRGQNKRDRLAAGMVDLGGAGGGGGVPVAGRSAGSQPLVSRVLGLVPLVACLVGANGLEVDTGHVATETLMGLGVVASDAAHVGGWDGVSLRRPKMLLFQEDKAPLQAASGVLKNLRGNGSNDNDSASLVSNTAEVAKSKQGELNDLQNHHQEGDKEGALSLALTSFMHDTELVEEKKASPGAVAGAIQRFGGGTRGDAGATGAVFARVSVTAVEHQANPDVVYKYTNKYQQIWRDEGSGADMDGAVWRAQNYQSEFCSLGDVANNRWGSPDEKAVLVSQRKAGALAPPTSFSLVWKDSGSGAKEDVAIYRMHAPSGYTCLGAVAVNSHSSKPDSKKYCCVGSKYVVKADTIDIWNDKGSGSTTDVSWWTMMRNIDDVLGIYAGTFIAVPAYSQPDAAYLLKDDGNTVRDIWSLPTVTSKPLSLYEVGELTMIWNDAGSGADADVSIWRAERTDGYYPLGDIVVSTHSKPTTGFLLRATNTEDSVRVPVSYRRIWNDSGSGANRDVQLWSVYCPPGFVSLGSVATSGETPELGSVYCVKNSYTTQGSQNSWVSVWKDHGSGASSDVGIFEAQANSLQQSVRGFGAVSSYSYKPVPPSLLNKQYLTYCAEKPIEKISMYSVEYDLSSERRSIDPVKMNPFPIENGSSLEQVSSRTLSYSVEESSTFTFSQAIEIGLALEIEAGVPLIGGAKTTIGITTTSTFETGDTTTETRTDEVTAKVKVPAHSKIIVWIEGSQFKVDIPYTATMKKVYFDGTESFATISGVYKGVDVSETKITYGKIEPF